jgi:hypothetical protein
MCLVGGIWRVLHEHRNNQKTNKDRNIQPTTTIFDSNRAMLGLLTIEMHKEGEKWSDFRKPHLVSRALNLAAPKNTTGWLFINPPPLSSTTKHILSKYFRGDAEVTPVRRKCQKTMIAQCTSAPKSRVEREWWRHCVGSTATCTTTCGVPSGPVSDKSPGKHVKTCLSLARPRHNWQEF